MSKIRLVKSYEKTYKMLTKICSGDPFEQNISILQLSVILKRR